MVCTHRQQPGELTSTSARLRLAGQGRRKLTAKLYDSDDTVAEAVRVCVEGRHGPGSSEFPDWDGLTFF